MTTDRHADLFDDLAELYAAGALDERQRVEFEAHLDSGCELCQQRLAQCAQTTSALTRLVAPATPPDWIRTTLLSRIAAEGKQRSLAQAAATASDADPALLVVRASEGDWADTPYLGVKIRMLFVDRQRRCFTALVRMAPGANYPAHSHHEAEECLVLEGDLRFNNQVLHAGDFLRTGPGFEQGMQTTEQGCLLYLTTPMA
jgi:anti-sigma factor ChrR (cupin superfamily)